MHQVWVLGAPFFRAARAITFERASRTVSVGVASATDPALDTPPLEAAPGHDAPAAPAGIARVRVVEVPFGPEDAHGALEEPATGDGGIEAEQLEKNSLEASSLADAAAALGMADGSGGLRGPHGAHGHGAHGAQPAGALLPGEVSGLDDL